MMKRSVPHTFLTFLFIAAGCAVAAQSHKPPDGEIELVDIRPLARVTGGSLPGETLPNPNRTDVRFDVAGTDLGIVWEMGKGRFGVFFGDTNGAGFQAGKGGGNGSNWRSNVLGFSADTLLEDGMTIDQMAVDDSGRAREICAGAHANPRVYQTSIPTAAIHAGNGDFVHYMNIYKWNAPGGRWLTNFSSLYGSYDGGRNWERVTGVTFDSNSRFSQICYAKKDNWIYMIGSLSGRGSAAYLARFREADITRHNRYEYWNGTLHRWVQGRESSATPVIPAPVGEASLIFNKTLQRWIILYSYDARQDPARHFSGNGLVYRDAVTLQGPWSRAKMIPVRDSLPGYAPFIHPLSEKGTSLFYTRSIWGPYNVFLMKATLQMHQ
ncbi:DUF4185 domain-containing protein [Niabella ginsenosidivorans]|nr:DUF4185 domain-containing protein [Niabella ginsenosidivorans]